MKPVTDKHTEACHFNIGQTTKWKFLRQLSFEHRSVNMMKHVADCFPLITLQNFEHQPLPTESTLEIRVSAPGSFKLYIYLQFHVLIAQSL